MKQIPILFLIPVLFLFLISDGNAKGKSKPPKKTSGWIFSASTWLSTGQTDLNFTSGSPFAGDPTSELFYQDLDSYTLELSAEYRLRRWFVRGLTGYGGVSGTLVDDDYVSSLGADFFLTTTSGEHRFSRSQGEIEDDDLLYLTFDAGYYLFYNRRLKIRGYLGYLHLSEDLQSLEHTQVECTSVFLCQPAGTPPSTNDLSISNHAKWNSLRMGLGVSMHLWKRLNLELDTAFIPLAFLDSEDIHHLRTDLAQDPSFRDSGQGLGYTLDAMLIYNVWSSLFIKAGYRYWDLRVDNGVAEAFGANGISSKAVLNDFNTYRHGAVLGVEFRY